MTEYIRREAVLKSLEYTTIGEVGAENIISLTLRAAREKVEKLPVLQGKDLFPAWRDPEKDPPEVETEVLVCTGVMTIWALQRRTMKTAMFSPRTVNGIGKTFPIGEHTTKNGTTTESRKAGGNTATSTRTTFTTTR